MGHRPDLKTASTVEARRTRVKRIEYVDDFDTTRRHQCRKYYITLVLSEGREDPNGDMEIVYENHIMSAALVSAAAFVCDVEASVESPGGGLFGPAALGPWHADPTRFGSRRDFASSQASSTTSSCIREYL
jgi:hypothetical protein